MSPQRAESIVRTTMWVLAATFAVVGILFIATPAGVVGRVDDVGDWLGGFSPAPGTGVRLWLALGFAYMTVITGIALLVASDVARYRHVLLALAAGKAASSLAAGFYFAFDHHVFIYLVNFVVDGTLVAIVLWCWSLAGRVEPRTPG
ncbi:MAG: hypothetical protein U0T02_01215 [Solirubrobacteraceae bacterium]